MPDEPHAVYPAKWSIGPPAPCWIALIARACIITTLGLVGHWVHAILGGVGFEPLVKAESKGNDTSAIFNWHPVMMTLAFAVFMAEAVLTYKSPLVPNLSREARKKVHWLLHSLAGCCILLGLLAAFKSHSLKAPKPIPDLYSPHSYLGLFTVMLASGQFLAGLISYLTPKLPLPQRIALGPVHRYLGMATWTLGLATMAVGIQEKTAFVQFGAGLTGEDLYSPAIRLPATIQILLVLVGLTVLYHQVPPAQPVHDKSLRQDLLRTPPTDREEDFSTV